MSKEGYQYPRNRYTCKFPSCESVYYSGLPPGAKNKRFFSFPKDPVRLQAWKEICNIKPKENALNYHICSDHFSRKDLLDSGLMRNLVNGAVPLSLQAVEIYAEHNYSKYFRPQLKPTMDLSNNICVELKNSSEGDTQHAIIKGTLVKDFMKAEMESSSSVDIHPTLIRKPVKHITKSKIKQLLKENPSKRTYLLLKPISTGDVQHPNIEEISKENSMNLKLKLLSKLDIQRLSDENPVKEPIIKSEMEPQLELSEESSRLMYLLLKPSSKVDIEHPITEGQSKKNLMNSELQQTPEVDIQQTLGENLIKKDIDSCEVNRQAETRYFPNISDSRELSYVSESVLNDLPDSHDSTFQNASTNSKQADNYVECTCVASLTTRSVSEKYLESCPDNSCPEVKDVPNTSQNESLPGEIITIKVVNDKGICNDEIHNNLMKENEVLKNVISSLVNVNRELTDSYTTMRSERDKLDEEVKGYLAFIEEQKKFFNNFKTKKRKMFTSTNEPNVCEENSKR